MNSRWNATGIEVRSQVVQAPIAKGRMRQEITHRILPLELFLQAIQRLGQGPSEKQIL